MRFSRSALLLALASAFALPSGAQTKKLTMSGAVTDSRTHLPVSGAIVAVVGDQANQEVTDSNGKFLLRFREGVQEGEGVRIHVEMQGYRVYEAWQALSTTVPLLISLEPSGVHPKTKLSATIRAAVKNRIVSALHSRATPAAQGQTLNAEFSSQELLYEWSVSVSTSVRSTGSLRVRYLQENDIYRVEPATVQVERIPESVLGFSLLLGQKPDYYALIVRFNDLSKTQPLTVTVRRTINAPLVEADLIQLTDFRSTLGQAEQPKNDLNLEVAKLNRQAKTLAAWRWTSSNKPLEARSPNAIAPGEIEAIVEASCKDDTCDELTLGNLVARWNRSALSGPSESHGTTDSVGATAQEHGASNREVTPPNRSAQTMPELGLRFVHPKHPALVIVNPSNSTAREIKWTVVLWNLDLPDRDNPLPIPVSTFDWIKGGHQSGPEELFSGPLVAPLLGPGSRLFGSASVDCPECLRGRTYIVYIVFGEGGWFAEVEGETFGNLLIPRNFLKESREQYFKSLERMALPDHRIPITE